MENNIEEVNDDLLNESEKLQSKEPWDPDAARKSDPEHEYMRSLLYDAKRWKEAGQPEFEKRVLIILRDFLHEHIQTLNT